MVHLEEINDGEFLCVAKGQIKKYCNNKEDVINTMFDFLRNEKKEHVVLKEWYEDFELDTISEFSKNKQSFDKIEWNFEIFGHKKIILWDYTFPEKYGRFSVFFDAICRNRQEGYVSYYLEELWNYNFNITDLSHILYHKPSVNKQIFDPNKFILLKNNKYRHPFCPDEVLTFLLDHNLIVLQLQYETRFSIGIPVKHFVTLPINDFPEYYKNQIIKNLFEPCKKFRKGFDSNKSILQKPLNEFKEVDFLNSFLVIKSIYKEKKHLL